MPVSNAKTSTSDNSPKLQHLGLILDGNRRWARSKNMPTLQGHKKGYENLKTIVKEAINRDIPYISAYIFSTENWKRSQEEVSYLMDLALWIAKNEVKELNKEDIRVRFLGCNDNLSDKLIKAINDAEELTKNNTRGTVALCFNYGGHNEITNTVKSLIEKDIKPEEVTDDLIASNLYADDVPPVDLIVRTSGEQRISGFMLWRAAYAEFLFIEKNWPDFNVEDLEEVIDSYNNRERRFGG